MLSPKPVLTLPQSVSVHLHSEALEEAVKQVVLLVGQRQLLELGGEVVQHRLSLLQEYSHTHSDQETTAHRLVTLQPLRQPATQKYL